MKRKLVCAILTMSLFQTTVSVYAEKTNFFNDSQITVGATDNLSQAVRDAIDGMGLKNVTDVLIASGDANSYFHDIIIVSESDGKFLSLNVFITQIQMIGLATK